MLAPRSIPLRRRAARFALAALIAMVVMQAAHADDPASGGEGYVPGRGYRIPDTDWHIGGYFTAGLDAPESDGARFAIDNLSLFLWWQGEGRWKFFSEFEYENPIATRTDPLSSDDYLSWERAYLEYALSDVVNVRAGKFLTPIGRWNEIHATPLVWTTSRPLVTTLAFPTNMTGVMVTGAVPVAAEGVTYSIYASAGSEIRPNPEIDPFSSAIGARVVVPLGAESEIGFSYADFEQERSRAERKQLVGVDFLWRFHRFELSAEAAVRESDRGVHADERGAFVQLAVPITRKLFGVGRFETFKPAGETQATTMWVGGLDYRVTPALVLKAEWLEARHNTVGAPDGFLASIAVLL